MNCIPDNAPIGAHAAKNIDSHLTRLISVPNNLPIIQTKSPVKYTDITTNIGVKNIAPTILCPIIIAIIVNTRLVINPAIRIYKVEMDNLWSGNSDKVFLGLRSMFFHSINISLRKSLFIAISELY